VSTYSNAVPRIGSAADKDKKILGSTFYDKTEKVKKQKGSSSGGSERKKIKMNNFVRLN
jgi:hypothetical protein